MNRLRGGSTLGLVVYLGLLRVQGFGLKLPIYVGFRGLGFLGFDTRNMGI